MAILVRPKLALIDHRPSIDHRLRAAPDSRSTKQIQTINTQAARELSLCRYCVAEHEVCVCLTYENQLDSSFAADITRHRVTFVPSRSRTGQRGAEQTSQDAAACCGGLQHRTPTSSQQGRRRADHALALHEMHTRSVTSFDCERCRQWTSSSTSSHSCRYRQFGQHAFRRRYNAYILDAANSGRQGWAPALVLRSQ
jgi:hypothetical protein